MWEKFDLKKWQKAHRAPEPRSFALMLVVVFSFLGLVTFKINPFFIGLAILSLAVGVLKPSLFSLPNQWWQNLGFILGWITTPIVLTLVYFLIFVPMVLVIKLFGHKALPFRAWVTKSKDCRFERIF
jgi:hypothetical protein